MLNRIFNRGRKVEMALKTFEIWRKVVTVGTFINQEKSVCVGTIAARSLEEANREAATYDCYAVGLVRE